MPLRRFDAVVFDKDGTLLAFHPTWDAAFGEMLVQMADGNKAALNAAATAIGYDLETSTVPNDSPIIAESGATLTAMMAPALGRTADDELVAEIDRLLASLALASVTAAVGAEVALASLAAAGVGMAVATNDAEGTARLQVERLGWATYFDAVVGHDSGYGAKPDASMVLACLGALGVDASRAVMVGDSGHDLAAARRAGVASVLVGDSAGVAPRPDHVIADLAALPALVLG